MEKIDTLSVSSVTSAPRQLWPIDNIEIDFFSVKFPHSFKETSLIRNVLNNRDRLFHFLTYIKNSDVIYI